MKKITLAILFVLQLTFVNWAQSQTTLRLHPTANPVVGFHDNFGSANQNYATPDYFGAFYQPGAVGGYNGGRGLVNFDLSSIPQGSVITSAKLDLYGRGPLGAPGDATSVGNIGDNQCYLQRITTSWNQNQVTWNTQPQVSDIDKILLHSSDSIKQDYPAIDITQLVQDMIDDPNNSFGLRISLVNEAITRGLFFCSSHFADTSKIPTLTLTYVNGNCTSPVIYNIGIDDVEVGFHDNYNSANTNYKTANYFGAFYQPGASGGYNGGRGIMKLDISAIPPGIQITSAKINLYGIGYVSAGDATSVGSVGNNACYLELVDSAWVDNLVTWNNQPPVRTIDRILLPASTSTTQNYLGVDITKLIQDMINDPARNYGFRIRLVNEAPTTALLFCSTENSDPSKHPQIIVTVCGATSGCLAYFTAQSSKDSVYFHNYSSANITGATWDFGDSTTSTNTYTNATFTHHYTNAGEYTVTLYTSDSAGSCLDTFSRMVHACNTNASFTYDASTNVVKFTSSSSNATQIRWSFGDGSYDNNNLSSVSHPYALAGDYKVILQVWGDSSFQCFDSTSTTIHVVIPNPDTLAGIVFNDIDADGIKGPGETGKAGIKVTLSNSGTILAQTITDTSGHYSFMVGSGTWNIDITYPSSYTQTIPTNPWHYTVTDSAGQNLNSLNFGLHNSLVTISGTVFYDTNDNGIMDPDEAGVPYQYVQIGYWIYYTNSNGEYAATLHPGTYTVSYYPFTTGFTLSIPDSGYYTVIAKDSGQIYSGNNFGIWADPTLKDLAIDISPYTSVVRGFQAWYLISYANYGAQDADASITMNFDPHFTFDYSDGTPSVDNIHHTITWNLGSLAPGEYGAISCWFDTPRDLVLGSPVLNTVEIDPIAGDNFPANNISELFQTVQGSFDPNEKQVSPTGPIHKDQVLNYMVEFQNTGTSPAVNIVVVDTISQNLDMSTFKMLSATHAYSLKITENVVKWTFSDIQLPDSGTSQSGSIGFVKYSISPLASITDRTPISNFADIYFDFNDPVRTNTTTNNIDLTLDINKIRQSVTGIALYPNPMDEFANIEVGGPTGKEFEVSITNVLGEKIRTMKGVTGQSLKIDKGDMIAGLYMYKVTIDGLPTGEGKFAVK